MKRSIKISALLASLLFVSGEILAAGLGRMSVMSSLGQPLRAEIELLSVQAEELGNIEAKLASPEAFRQARLQRSMAISDVQLSVDKRPNGQPVVKITSATPVSDPFLDLLIELNWSSGRILREYTILLDPTPDSKPAVEPAKPPALATVVERAPAAGMGEARPTPAREPAATAAPEQPGTYGPVKSGETLRAIARKVLPPDVTMDMMIASLYEANKKAFAKNNLNLLKRGQVLTVPDREAVMLMHSPSQARQLLNEHAAAWHDLQNRMAEQAARNVAEPTEGQAGKGKIVQAKPEEKPAAATAPKDVLKLSKGEPAGAKQSQRVEALEEEVAAKSRALQEAQDKVGQLERTVQDLQRLMELKAKEGAKAQPEQAKPEAAPVEAAKPKAEKAKPKATAPVAPPAEEPGFLASLFANPLYLIGGIAAVILAGLLWVFMVGSRRRKGLSDFEQSVMTGGDQFKTSIFKTTANGAAGERSTMTQSGVATDFSRLGLGSIDTHEVDPIAEAEVYMAYGRDAQAEEILKEALSKDPSRHEIVLKLLEIYATRQDTATFETQASELYANLGDPSSAVWQKAAEMGRKLDPSNPLYRVFGEVPSLPADEPVSDLPEVEAAPEEMVADISDSELAAAQDAEVAEGGLDFDLEGSAELAPEPVPEPTPETEVEAAISELGDLDFDTEPLAVPDMVEDVAEFPAFGQVVEPALETADEIEIPDTVEAMELPEEFGALDLTPEVPAVDDALAMPGFGELADLGQPEAPATPEAGATDKLPDLDFSGIDLDLNEEVAPPAVAEPEMAAPAEIDADLLEEVNTKLDLARAYMEMGDKEGAREILDEVVKEGDAEQKQEAEKLISSL